MTIIKQPKARRGPGRPEVAKKKWDILLSQSSGRKTSTLQGHLEQLS
eukprot:CAMPEP_0113266166 /NCGR_PEP_ID=MMETSP0008_2-20120614/19913_1 /TAXON_ID=97485 /ORGANISM="Prymnesium parvum" /LENGTH=46 /DNA_ID=CAMNT_0000115079 /DNA_START=17 /DNA_END=157 /DNA_ORIENTATION=+ /assembly_acc=CAM_ASM_000153